MMEDIKPSLSEMERSTRVGGASASMAGAGGENEDKKERTGSLPPYAHAGAPGLPGAWTRPRWDRVCPASMLFRANRIIRTIAPICAA